MPSIIDNEDVQLATALNTTLAASTAFDACVGYLNLRGWRRVTSAVGGLSPASDRPAARILVGMAMRPEHVIRDQYRIRRDDDDGMVTQGMIPPRIEAAIAEFRAQLTLGLPTNGDEAALREFRDQLARRHVVIKFYGRRPLHAKLYLAHLDDGQLLPLFSYVGSSNLTLAGLRGQGELNVEVTERSDTQVLLDWFEDRWNDRFCVDVTERLVELLDESWASEEQPLPYHLHLRIAYELSQDAREGLRDFDIPQILRDQLLTYQADAVRVASKIVERRGGVMIGDVVGLGKTLTATAIARLLEETYGYETLVVCPKNLVKMWKDYIREYRLHGEVVSLSMATRELADMARHRVLIVDESHNLRNPQTKSWQAVRDYIERNEPRLILLTATPYNKEYLDVAGQLRLFLDPNEDLLVRPEQLIDSIGELEVARQADSRLSSLQAFEVSEHPEDWQRLMSLFLVRRTRGFILEQYGEDDGQGRRFLRFPDGRPFYFPKRLPRPLPYAAGPGDQGNRLASEETVDALSSLALPRYRLGSFLLADLIPQNADEEEIVERLRTSGGNLQGFIKTTLMKRLASSGPAFLLSLERHLLRNHVFLHALDRDLPLPLGTIVDPRWDRVEDPGDDDVEEGAATDRTGQAANRTDDDWASAAADRYEEIAARPVAGLSWAPARLFQPALSEALRADNEVLRALLDDAGAWDPAADAKVAALAGLISERHPHDKVLVFSEYADTATYVSDALRERLPDVELAAATGASADPTRLARRFSPASNATLGGLPKGESELRVLVATDVLSEGQNLQDAAVVVNYDLPWTIIRIIQRAGRVDRVGQEAPEVFVYSFLPHDDIEAVIRLRNRISLRLKENAQAFGADERFFDLPDETSDIRGLFDGTAELDDDSGADDVDWASTALAIWEAAGREDQAIAEALPGVSFSTRQARDGEDDGVLIYTRTERGIDGLAWNREGETTRVLTPFEALRISESSPDEAALPRLAAHHELVAEAVQGTLIESARRPIALTHSGPRARLYRLMSAYLSERQGTFEDTPELRRLVDRVYHQPLQESAKHRVLKAMRTKTPEDVVGLAVDLDLEGRLLTALEDGDDDIRIVCSMGVKR